MAPQPRPNTLSGAMNPGQWGTGYRTPQNRNFTFEADVVDDLDSLPERLAEHYQQALMFHLADAAQRVIDTARHYLVRLEEPPVMVNAEGTAIHGYDTGTLYTSLEYRLAESLLYAGVYYDILSDAADYWTFVEFGHWVFSKEGPWFWPGYHMLATAIEANTGYILAQCREAWHDAAIQLAMEAHVPEKSGQIGFTRGIGVGGVPNVAGIRP